MPAKLTQQEFINRAKEKHGESFDYSCVVYLNQKSKVLIKCLLHGEQFLQTPEKHLKQNGCHKCQKEQAGKILRETTEGFIKKAVCLYGNEFDYRLVEYKTSRDKVKIICKKHGVFEQVAAYHLSGCKGCHDCWNELRSKHISSLGKKHNKPNKRTEKFIEESIAIHGDSYLYNLVEYKNSKEPVEIVCKIHGSFWQIPTNHIHKNKHGCPSCAVTGFDKNKEAILYVYSIEGACRFTGFGISGKYDKRKTHHNNVLKKNEVLVVSEFVVDLPGIDAYELETLLKQTFPLAACSKDIPGFKTESTTTDYNTVVAFVQDYIAKNK